MKMSRKKWAEVKIEYITSEVTLEELEVKYGIHLQMLKNNCTKEGWVQQRELYLKQLEEEALNRQKEIDLNNWQIRNTKHAEIAEMILNKIEVALLNNDFKNNPDTYLKLLNALEKAQLIERKCYGIDRETKENTDTTIIVKLPNFEGEE